MITKAKKFDCVEMKNRIQAEMLAEYNAQKDEYASFVDFVKAKTKQSEWVQRMKKRIAGI